MSDLTKGERAQVAEILTRRANEIAGFHGDYRSKPEHYGSVELALSREIDRLRAELAASREREQRMRDAIDAAANIIGDAPWWADIWAALDEGAQPKQPLDLVAQTREARKGGAA